MGGQALSVPTRRYEADEYFKLIPELTEQLENHFKKVHVVQAYKDKPSFGDMDILIYAENINFKVADLITELFKPTEIARNTSVYSFDYKELQIDLILVTPKNWETSIVYYSYNDLGNLMGRIANKLGIKYGHFGLAYKHTHLGVGYGDVMLSTDHSKIFEFLGFSWDRYKEGFDTLEDVFLYVINSEKFTPQLFAYENLDHANRTRNAKRKTYQQFLDYLKEHVAEIPNEKEYVHHKKKTAMQERDWEILKEADEFFGCNTVETIKEWDARVLKKKEVSKKFNGRSVMEEYGFEGKDLGNVLGKFKGSFETVDDYDNFILSHSYDEILKEFEKANDMKEELIKK